MSALQASGCIMVFIYRNAIRSIIIISLLFTAELFPQPRSIPEPSPPNLVKNNGTAREVYRISRLARRAESDGNLERSLELWQAVLAIKSDDYSAYRGVQRAYIGLERYRDALDFLDTILESLGKDRGRIDPLMIRADRIEVMLAAEMDIEVDAEIEATVETYKGNERIYTEIASILFGYRRDDDAIALIRQGRLDCKNPYLFARELARWLEARMNWREAIEEYLLYLEDRPTRLNYVTGAIGDLTEEADSIAALAIANCIENANEKFAVTLRQLLASLHFKAKRYQQALEQYKKLDQIGKEPGEELLKFADLLMTEEEFTLAREAYGELANRQTTGKFKAYALLGKGRAAQALGYTDSARVAYQCVLEPGSTPEAVFEAYKALGDLEYGNGGSLELARNHYNSALKTANRARISSVKRDNVKVLLALAWEKDGRLKEAERLLKEIIRTNRKSTEAVSAARLELARLAFRQGDFDEAKNHANALLISDPSSEHANEALVLEALFFDLKGYPDQIQALGRADLAQFTGKDEQCLAILDTLVDMGEPRVKEEALWRIYRLEVERHRLEAALGALNMIIDLGESALRCDLALFTAGKQCETKMGDQRRAVEYYEKLLIDYPDSPLVDQARRNLKAIVDKPS